MASCFSPLVTVGTVFEAEVITGAVGGVAVGADAAVAVTPVVMAFFSSRCMMDLPVDELLAGIAAG